MRATVVVLSAMAVLIGIACQSRTPPANVLLNVNGVAIDAEVAATREVQERGLMGRTFLDDGRGMLFVFRSPRRLCMWMRNTPIPLSVAFVAVDSTIINVADMHPNTDVEHCSSEPVSFALEVPRGWFAARGVKPGDLMGGLPAL